MLRIVIPRAEMFDENTQEFVDSDDVTIDLEHSLLSLSKWESKWEKPFLTDDEKSDEEALDYVRLMTLTPDVPPEAFYRITAEQHQEISRYIQAKMTATWFSNQGPKRPRSREIITNEVIYYWMVALQVPFSCEEWHLNRLLTLIQVCNEKNKPKKSMSRSDAASRQRALNKARQQKYGTRG